MAPRRPRRPPDPHLDRAREAALRGGAAPPWTQVFADHPAPAPATFGRGRTLSVYWGADAEAAPVTIALPTASPDDYWPDEDTLRIGGSGAPRSAGVRARIGDDRRRRDVREGRVHPARPRGADRGRSGASISTICSIRGDIAAFGARADERRLAVLTADHRAAAVLENVVLLDRDDIMVRDCTPMRQEPVPGSSTRPGRVRYPDYPLRADLPGPGRDR